MGLIENMARLQLSNPEDMLKPTNTAANRNKTQIYHTSIGASAEMPE